MGNNSCGSHSLIYGATRHHVLEARGVMSDGAVEVFRDYTVAELEQRFGPRFWEKQDNTAKQADTDKQDNTEKQDNTAKQADTDKQDNSEKQDNSAKQADTDSQAAGGHQPGAVSRAEAVYGMLIRWALDAEVCAAIDAGFPDRSLRRRSCGYAIDETIAGLRDESRPLAERTVNLCPLLCGSEGTLALISEIKVDLDPIPGGVKGALLVLCDSLPKSYRANLVCLEHKPEAVELIDGKILDLALQRGVTIGLEAATEAALMAGTANGGPAGVLVAEMRGADDADLRDKLQRLQEDLTAAGLAYACHAVDGADLGKVWALRKAGLGLLSGMKGDAKPIGVIEDTAVSPERLPEYLEEFDAMLADLGLACVYYGHISTGELHLRPIIDIKTAEGKRQFRAVAERTAALVKKHRGSLSGEHGDGRLRGEFIPLMYGDECYRLMRQVKATFDPEGLLNVGKIIDTPPMDSGLRYDVDQHYAVEDALGGDGMYYNWRAAFVECQRPEGVDPDLGMPANQTRAMMCALEQCNGAADCRKSVRIGGVLCPAYKATGFELMTTRARANVLRETLTRGAGDGGQLFADGALAEVLKSCLACKGCRGECPSGVDMTRLRSEVLQHVYDAKGMPLAIRAVSHMAALERLGAIAPWAYNAVVGNSLTAGMIKRVLGFAPQRSLPRLDSRTGTIKKKIKAVPAQPKGVVNVFLDEFTRHQDGPLGEAFVDLLLALGYEVRLPRHTESGRAGMSKGNLRHAARCARRNVELLADVVTADEPLVGIEPSTILSFRDEYPDLVDAADRDRAKALGANALLYDEFLLREIEAGRITANEFGAVDADIWLHGHCHQKALVGVQKTAEVLRRLLPGATVHVIPSGCCGMAGSYGYEADHYDTSMAIGETVLFPAVRGAQARSKASGRPAIVLAPGTSCREQIHHGTGVTALHPLQILQWVKCGDPCADKN